MTSTNYLKKITNLDQQQKKWIIVSVLCIFCLGSLLALMYPTLDNLRAVRRQFRAQEESVKVGSEKLNTLTGMQERFEEIRLTMAERFQRFFTEEEASLFLKDLNQGTSAIGGRIVLIRPVAEQKVAQSDIDAQPPLGYVKSLVQVNFQGSFLSLLNLLEMFKNNEKLIGVEEMKINSGQNANDTLNVDLTLALYKFVPQAKDTE